MKYLLYVMSLLIIVSVTGSEMDTAMKLLQDQKQNIDASLFLEMQKAISLKKLDPCILENANVGQNYIESLKHDKNIVVMQRNDMLLTNTSERGATIIDGTFNNSLYRIIVKNEPPLHKIYCAMLVRADDCEPNYYLNFAKCILYYFHEYK
tara:strand:- start:127 stop:579 length:453 start_codon:yes stop_codon:yes gene_type:complete